MKNFLRNVLVLTIILVVGVLGGRDFYKILGVNRSATPKEIKKAFRRLSVKYHPDKNPDPEAKELYKDINEANEVLSDPDKRRVYDRSGEDGVNKMAQQEQAGGMGPFDMFFGGHRSQEEANGPPINLKMRVSLEDVYNGKEIEITYTKQTICPHCRGNGADSQEDLETCPRWNGQGVILQTIQRGNMIQQFQQHWDHCNGEGTIIKNKWHVCHGSKVTKSMDFLVAEVEKGIPDGHVVSYEEAGDEYLNVRTSTVNIAIKILPHDKFERDGDNLKTKVKLTLEEALLGFNKSITHLDGHNVRLNKLGVTNPGDIQKIIGEGMPHFQFGSEHGDLYVKYEVEMPNTFTDKQRELFKQLFNAK